MANLNNGPVCINHHDRPAVAHCASCRRPICEECLVEKDGFKCCSKECLQTALASTAITNDIISRRGRAGSKAKLGSFIKWIIILAVLAGIWFSGLGPKWLRWLKRKKNQTVQTVQQKAQEGVDKQHQKYQQQGDLIDQLSQ